MAVTATDTHRAIEAVWRIESARLIASLARVMRDVGRAEELAQDALVAALEQWPVSGVPDNPAAWLMATAKHRAIDQLRRRALHARKEEDLTREIEEQLEAAAPASVDDADQEIGDDLLRLVFTACHPVLATEARVALTLRLLGGLTTAEIARAFLVAEPTIAQRIVRAKRALADARVPFEVPRGEELALRLASVLEVIYLIFNEGYAATAGDDWMRPGLCEDALRLGRILAELAPGEPEVHGLVALMEIQASRSARAGRTVGRTDPAARPEPCPLGPAPDPARACSARARGGARWRRRAVRAAGGDRRLPRARTHARTRPTGRASSRYYDALARARAVAGGRAEPCGGRRHGVRAGRGARARRCARRPSRRSPAYHHLPAVRGDLLFKLGRLTEARAEFERAAALTRNARERDLLLERAARCGQA